MLGTNNERKNVISYLTYILKYSIGDTGGNKEKLNGIYLVNFNYVLDVSSVI